MHIAVKDLVEQGQPLLLGYPQADLDERPTFDLFLILAGFAQGTVAAIEVGISSSEAHLLPSPLPRPPVATPKADLDERPTFDLFLILAGFAQGTVAAIEVGISDVIDNAGGLQPILTADPLEEPPLPSVGVQRFQAIQGADEALFGQSLQVQEEIQIGTLQPSRHVIEAAIVQTVSIDQTEDCLAVIAQLFGQLNFVGEVIKHQ